MIYWANVLLSGFRFWALGIRKKKWDEVRFGAWAGIGVRKEKNPIILKILIQTKRNYQNL